MTKQEIDGLKVGDVIIHKGNQEIIIKEILVSKVIDFVVFVSDSVYLGSEDLKLECCKLKQQPKKIPYTPETFPKNAVFIKGKSWIEKDKRAFYVEEDCLVTCSGMCIFFDEKEQMDSFEIGCQVIKDGKIEIEWKPFYQV